MIIDYSRKILKIEFKWDNQLF